MTFQEFKAYASALLSTKGFVPGKIDTDRSLILVHEEGGYVGIADLETHITMVFVQTECPVDPRDFDDNVQVVQEDKAGNTTVLKGVAG